MPAPNATSPTTGNLRVGKGALWFKKEGAADFVHLGNCTDVTLTPDMETLEHFSSLYGTRVKDLVVVLTKQATLAFTMEEFTPFNLSLMALGTIDEAAVGGTEVEIFSESTVSGEIKFISANDIGPKIDMYLHNVSIRPTGDISMISDEFGDMECEADVLPAQSGLNVGKFGYFKWTNLEPAS